MAGLLDELGIDPDRFDWTDIALCRGVPTNFFFDDYEVDVQKAKAIDSMCQACPTQQECGEYGVKNGEWGVWGGLYLVGGKVDMARNAHKHPEDLAELMDRYDAIQV